MATRTRARELAAEFVAKDDPTGWFEQLYYEAADGNSVVPWADLRPNPNLIEFWLHTPIPSAGKTALIIGCGLGDDAQQLAEWGFQATAFDISASAVRECNRRFPGRVLFTVADLLNPPAEWTGCFDFVLESYTLQVLPPTLRRRALLNAANMVRESGHLLLIARGRNQDEPEGAMPWPLTRAEVEHVPGLHTLTFEDYLDQESPPVRRFRILYEKRSRV